MTIPRKLDQEQERNVCLAALCGVDTDYISKQWDVSSATVWTNIVGKYSLEWNDPLVEFYRQTGSRGRIRNSAHLYLAYDGKDVPKKELVDRTRDYSVYNVVATAIYVPAITQVVARTGLEGYLSTPEKAGWEYLLRVINPEWREAGAIAKKVLQQHLLQEYQRGEEVSLSTAAERFSLDKVVDNSLCYLFQKVKYGGLAITPKKAEVIERVLNTLTEREKLLLSARLELNGERAKTLSELGIEFDLSRSRVGQIEAKALRKLRHPSRARQLGLIAGLVTDDDLDLYRRELQEMEERQRWKEELYAEVYDEIRAQVLREAAQNPAVLQQAGGTGGVIISDSSLPIDQLELSVRSYNCLANAGISTVGELCRKSQAELLRTKNFGRRSLQEIKGVLGAMGLRLPEGRW